MKYIVEVYDLNGNLLYRFKNPDVSTKAGPVLIVGDKFIRRDTVILKCVAENAVDGNTKVTTGDV